MNRSQANIETGSERASRLGRLVVIEGARGRRTNFKTAIKQSSQLARVLTSLPGNGSGMQRKRQAFP